MLFRHQCLVRLIRLSGLVFLVCLTYYYCKYAIGIYEAVELRDGGSDYLGKGVSKVSMSLRVVIMN